MEENRKSEITRETGGDKRIAMRVSVVSVVINTLLSLMKLAAGIIAGSGAMISDAVHSASDVLSTFIVMIGVSVAEKESDKEHPYGHDRLECAAAVILAVILALTGIGIGKSGVEKIIGGASAGLAAPGVLALIAAGVSVAVKEWMYWYTRAAAKKINSTALMANAWEHRSDALSSVGAFAGILGARMGYPILDPIAALVICLFIEKAAYDVFVDAMGKMVDKACPDDMVERMRDIVAAQDGVERIDEIKTRLFGSKVYVDVEISVDAEKTLLEAHGIAQRVHDAIEEGIPCVKHCMVHENPLTED